MKNNIPTEITKAINALAKLPGVGRVSAKRAILHMLEDKTLISNVVESLNTLDENIIQCKLCRNTSVDSLCSICSDEQRDGSILCVVEGVSQLWAMETSDSFTGKYFALNGLLNALEGKGVEQVGINQLIEQIQNNNITEVILALSASVDGQTTSHVIADKIQEINPDINITSLAKGIPVGAGLDYMDSGTLYLALKNRNSIS